MNEPEALEISKANECIAATVKPAVQLFDEFWREGELAMLFGAAGTGKSLLAVQIADGLSRGTPMHGFVMPRGRRKVLYVDLSLSDARFRDRYGRFKFPQNLYRGRPRRDVDLCGWIRAVVETHGFRIVVVDDLSAVKRTHDGIRETLALIRGLKRLCSEFGISILALSDATEPSDGWASERDMQRSRVLCTVADSVFSIGRTRRPEGGRRIMQHRSRAAALFWNEKNCPDAEIKMLESGLLGFEFDERFAPDMDEKKKRLICEVVRLQEQEYKTFREIGAILGISKSWACDLYKKWTPAMGSGECKTQNAECKMSEPGAVATGEVDLYEDDDWDESEISDTASEWMSEENLSEPPAVAGGLLEYEFDVNSRESGDCIQPPATAGSTDLEPRSINDLEIQYNARHEPIYVESRDERTRRPMVWYQQFPEGTRRFQRMPFSIQVQHMNSGPFL